MLVAWTAPAMADAPIRYGIVLAGDYPGDHPSSTEAAQGVAQRSPLTNIFGMASEMSPMDADVIIRYTSVPGSFLSPGCGHGDIEAFSARSHQMLYQGKDTECNFKFTWEDVGKQVAAAFAPGTSAYNVIQSEKAPPPPPVPVAAAPPPPVLKKRPPQLAPADRLAVIHQAEQEGDQAQGSGQRAKAFAAYRRALEGGWSDDDASGRVREKLMKLVAKGVHLPEASAEAHRHSVRARTFLQDAHTAQDYDHAAGEYMAAIGAAPWQASNYYNLGLVQDQAGYLEDAMRNLKLYLVARPHAADAPSVQDKVYALEARIEKANSH